MKHNQPTHPHISHLQRHTCASHETLNAALGRIKWRAKEARGLEEEIEGWKDTGLVWSEPKE